MQHLLLLFGLLMAVVSVGRGIFNALESSEDFNRQWLTARVIAHGENPYEQNITGHRSTYLTHLLEGPARLIFEPDYLPSSLITILPFAALPIQEAMWAWLLCNLLATGVLIWSSLYLLRVERIRLSLSHPVLIATILFLCSTPWRNLIGAGQFSVIALTMFLLALMLQEKGRWKTAGVVLALSGIKYTLILPYALFFFLIDRHYKALGIAAVIHVVAHFTMSWHMSTNPLGILSDVTQGTQDVFLRNSLPNIWSLGRYISDSWVFMSANSWSILFILVLVGGLVRLWFYAPPINPTKGHLRLLWLGLLGIVAMVCIPNKAINHVFLFFPLIAVLNRKHFRTPQWFILVGIFYFFYGEKIILESQNLALGPTPIALTIIGYFTTFIGVIVLIIIECRNHTIQEKNPNDAAS